MDSATSSSRFIDRFDTAGLKDARAMLEELAA
jgi:hypothetical protein